MTSIKEQQHGSDSAQSTQQRLDAEMAQSAQQQSDPPSYHPSPTSQEDATSQVATSSEEVEYRRPFKPRKILAHHMGVFSVLSYDSEELHLVKEEKLAALDPQMVSAWWAAYGGREEAPGLIFRPRPVSFTYIPKDIEKVTETGTESEPELEQ